MPGANGYEVCRRAKQRRPDVPVLLLVGTFEPFDEGQARAVRRRLVPEEAVRLPGAAAARGGAARCAARLPAAWMASERSWRPSRTLRPRMRPAGARVAAEPEKLPRRLRRRRACPPGRLAVPAADEPAPEPLRRGHELDAFGGARSSWTTTARTPLRPRRPRQSDSLFELGEPMLCAGRGRPRVGRSRRPSSSRPPLAPGGGIRRLRRALARDRAPRRARSRRAPRRAAWRRPRPDRGPAAGHPPRAHEPFVLAGAGGRPPRTRRHRRRLLPTPTAAAG